MESMTLEEHRVWSAMVSKKLHHIYTQLCEFEALVAQEHDPPRLLEMLETINEIQVHHRTVVEKIKASRESILDKRNDLQTQMGLLEKSVGLLKLETPFKQEDVANENAME